MGRPTIGPASSRLEEGLAGRDVLVLSRPSDSCGWPGAVHTDTVAMVARCTVFPPTHWCSFRVKWALCQEAVRLGWDVFRRTHGSRPSPLRTVVTAMRQDCNYQLDNTKLG